MLDRAFRDRRLANLTVSRFAGSFELAQQQYSAQSSPPLLLIEANGADAQAITGSLEHLAECCDASTNLILLGRINDVELYRTLKRQGVADYIVLPSEPMRLVESITELFSDPNKTPRGKVFAFIGTRGGCGSSTLAHNTAFALSELEGNDVVVADLNLPFGSADVGFNLESPHGIRNVLDDPDRVDDTFLQRFTARYSDRLHLLAAPCSLDVEANVEVRSLEVTLEAIRRQSKFTFLDLPQLWSPWLREALKSADEVVVTALPELTSVRNARNLVDFLSASRALDAPPLLVVNRIGIARRSEVALKDLSQTVGLPVTFTIAEDPETFGRAAAQGKMLMEIGPRSKAAEVVRGLAVAIAHLEVKKPAGKSAFQWFSRTKR